MRQYIVMVGQMIFGPYANKASAYTKARDVVFANRHASAVICQIMPETKLFTELREFAFTELRQDMTGSNTATEGSCKCTSQLNCAGYGLGCTGKDKATGAGS